MGAMLADEPKARPPATMFAQMPPTGRAGVLEVCLAAKTHDLEHWVVEQFQREGRRLLARGQERDRSAGTRERDIEDTSLFGMIERFRLRQHKSQEGVIDCLRRHARSAGPQAQQDHMVCLEPLGPMNRHEPDG